MKQDFNLNIFSNLKSAFFGGAFLSLTVYIFARILFYEFTFTAWEEVSNFLVIVIMGGLMVSAAMLVFLLSEFCLQWISSVKGRIISNKQARNIELADYTTMDMNTAA